MSKSVFWSYIHQKYINILQEQIYVNVINYDTGTNLCKCNQLRHTNQPGPCCSRHNFV